MGESRAAVDIAADVDAKPTSARPNRPGTSLNVAARPLPGGRVLAYRRIEQGTREPEVITCRTVCDARGFLALEPSWRTLFAQSARTPFHSWEFLIEWWRHFVVNRTGGASGQYQVVIASSSADRIVGIAPFYVESNLGIKALGTTLQPFGSSSSMETMTDEPVGLYRTGYEVEASAAIQKHLMMTGDAWDSAIVRGPTVEPVGPALRIRGGGRFVQRTRRADGPMSVLLPADWETYRASLSKSMRDNIAYYPRRLTREIGPYQIRIARTPAQIGPATEALIALHRTRARSSIGLRHYNHIATDNQASFIRTWFRRAAERRNVAIFTLEIGGEIVAAQSFLRAGGRLGVYYSGFDERFSRYSPLTILTADAVRWAFNQKLARIDFPPAEVAWKSRWNAHTQAFFEDAHIHRINPGSLARWLGRRAFLRMCPDPWQHLGQPGDQQTSLAAVSTSPAAA